MAKKTVAGLVDKVLHPGKSEKQEEAVSVREPVEARDQKPKKVHRASDYSDHPKFAKFKQGAK